MPGTYINPAETGFYLTGTRYYDPEVGRFINADDTAYLGYDGSILSYNLFAYCKNNPVNMVDKTGRNAESVFLTWIETMWWLCAIDITLPVGDIVYLFGSAILGVAAFVSTIDITKIEIAVEQGIEDEDDLSDVSYPGDNPEDEPEGTEWRGNGDKGSGKGNYYNPKTGESWHPDLGHPEPIGPHWDYRAPSGRWYRVYPGNILIPK